MKRRTATICVGKKAKKHKITKEYYAKKDIRISHTKPSKSSERESGDGHGGGMREVCDTTEAFSSPMKKCSEKGRISSLSVKYQRTPSTVLKNSNSKSKTIKPVKTARLSQTNLDNTGAVPTVRADSLKNQIISVSARTKKDQNIPDQLITENNAESFETKLIEEEENPCNIVTFTNKFYSHGNDMDVHWVFHYSDIQCRACKPAQTKSGLDSMPELDCLKHLKCPIPYSSVKKKSLSDVSYSEEIPGSINTVYSSESNNRIDDFMSENAVLEKVSGFLNEASFESPTEKNLLASSMHDHEDSIVELDFEQETPILLKLIRSRMSRQKQLKEVNKTVVVDPRCLQKLYAVRKQ
ncbi:unnamed protein product [Moneuplotes crassus]|uniref:Uncharacterized protein n=1 Tax=Euplotes crassus TaxID=5936 RepID=A0AAD1UEF7_EUPCR|nr:unnamed protein product [Moneuplotes crassus]